MATKGYLLIETAVGKTRNVVAAVRAMDEVKSVDPVTGPYDIILVVVAKDLNSIGEFVTTKVHKVPGVNRTVTCLAV
jgi:DNA-binding Lrp family transcriptional regulator